MARINVLDTDPQTGTTTLLGWFDPDSATVYHPATRWTGSETIDTNTGSSREHQTLYRTAGGRWVLEETADYDAAEDLYTYLDAEEARDWLIRNEYSGEDVETATGAPLPPEMGRPEIGPQIKVRLPRALIERIDDLAGEEGVTRSAWIRQAVTRAAATSTITTQEKDE